MIEFASRFLDWWKTKLNPLLMREIRQAVRSRVHIYSFIGINYICLLILAIFVIAMGGAGTSQQGVLSYGAGDQAFGVLLLALGVISLCGIPMTVFLSHVYEKDRDSLDLLKVTTLSPGQIVRGKLLAGLVKLLLLISALIPFIGFSYILRGISFPVILGSLALIVLNTILLCLIYLYCSMLVNRGASKIFVMGFLMFVSGSMVVYLGSMSFNLGSIISVFLGYSTVEFLVDLGHNLLIWGCTCYFLYEANRCMLMNPSRNRSAPIRLAMLFIIPLTLCYPVLQATWSSRSYDLIIAPTLIGLWILLTITSFLWSTERPRIPRKSIKNYAASRFKNLRSVFLSGDSFGYRYSILCIALMMFLLVIIHLYLPMKGTPLSESRFFKINFTVAAYLCMYVGISYHVSRGLRSFSAGKSQKWYRGITFLAIMIIMIVPYLVGLLLFPDANDTAPETLAFFNPFVILTKFWQPEDINWQMLDTAALAVGIFLFLPSIVIGSRQINDHLKKADLQSQ